MFTTRQPSTTSPFTDSQNTPPTPSRYSCGERRAETDCGVRLKSGAAVPSGRMRFTTAVPSTAIPAPKLPVTGLPLLQRTQPKPSFPFDVIAKQAIFVPVTSTTSPTCTRTLGVAAAVLEEAVAAVTE